MYSCISRPLFYGPKSFNFAKSIFEANRYFEYIHQNFNVIHNHTTSRHSKLLDSDICEHLNALNSCVVNYSDECFVVLQRARTKQHLIVQEVIYILSYLLSVTKTLNTLNLLGDISSLT